MKVDAAHSSGKLVGPIYYVTTQKRAAFILMKSDAVIYVRDNVRFVLRTRKICIFYRRSRYSD